MIVQWILIISATAPHVQRFARSWISPASPDFTQITRSVLDRPKHAPMIELDEKRRIAVRAYSSLIFAIGFDDPDDETDAFELIHLLITVLDDYFGCVREADIIKKPEVIARAVELMISRGVVVDTNRGGIVRRLKHWK